MTPTFWTEERVAILKRGRAEDWPARKIADLLGCTRNAVLGKADRLGLRGSAHRGGRLAGEGRERATSPAPAPRRVLRDPAVRRPVALPVLHEEPPSRRIALADLKPGECGWIAGDDGCCCGHATTRMLARGRHIASPYCGFHSARAYRPVQERRPVLASAASGQRGHFSSAAPAGRPPARPKPLRRGEGPRENFA